MKHQSAFARALPSVWIKKMAEQAMLV